MAYAKKEHFSEFEQVVSEFAKALSHPARISILVKLTEENKCICGDIVDVMPLAQSTVSQHIKELKSAELVKGEIEGATSCYCINWNNLEKEIENFEKLFEKLKAKKFANECC
jgi:ArsR family transcriptional regulator